MRLRSDGMGPMDASYEWYLHPNRLIMHSYCGSPQEPISDSPARGQKVLRPGGGAAGPRGRARAGRARRGQGGVGGR
ncbi:hypothetical protein RSP03_03790 [Cereibacter sphaeroides]|nr:hypothetical protein RSP03_03790 [Cereibacter sphaeroides]